MSVTRKSSRLRHSGSTAARLLAATLGAYALTSLATVALSLMLAALGVDRVEAVIAATTASYAIATAIAVAAYHARSVARAWGWLVAAAIPLALLCALLNNGPTP